MPNSIVLFHTELNTLNLFSDQMKIYFEKHGYEIYIYDLEDSVRSMGLLYAYIQTHKVVAMIGFNSKVFGAQTPSGVSIWETLGIPCINILVDHPYWYHDILSKMPGNSAVLCVDMNHMNYVSTHYPQIPIVGFLPHGGTQSAGHRKNFSERNIDVLYVGSLYAPQNIDLSKQRWGFDAEKLVAKCIEHLKTHPTETVEDTLLQYCQQAAESWSDFIPLAVYMERSISFYFRNKLLSIVAKSGLKMQIYGAGYENCDWIALPNVTWGGMISPESVLDKIGDSKILLNSMPWFKNGSHERVFNGMLNGAVVVTEQNPYFEGTLPEGTWVRYSLEEDSLFRMCREVGELLDDEESWNQITAKAYEFASKGQTWEHRAEEIAQELLAIF